MKRMRERGEGGERHFKNTNILRDVSKKRLSGHYFVLNRTNNALLDICLKRTMLEISQGRRQLKI